MMQLRRLRLEGAGAEPAEVCFDSGLTVISGASNTGKSYIFDCIDFLLGAEAIAKEIDEAAPYRRALLELVNSDGEQLTLVRALKGGDLEVHRCSITQIGPATGEIVTWDRRRSPHPDLSTVLLKFAGIAATAKVRKNALGETEALSLRLLKPLFLVSETAIMDEGAPVHDGTGFAQTARASAFSFALTGTDDDAIIAAPDPKLTRAGALAKIDLLEKLMAPIIRRLNALPSDDRTPGERVEILDARIDEVSSALSEDESAWRTLREDRADHLMKSQRAESQLVALGEMVRRFELLDQRYSSDLGRLNFMAEASHYFQELQETNCPMCGQPISEEHLAHIRQGPTIRGVRASAKAEAAKILALKAELELGRTDLASRQAAQKVRAAHHQLELARIDRVLQDRVGPRLQSLRQELQALFATRLTLEGEQSDRTQLAELGEARVAAEMELRPTPRREWAGPSSVAIVELCEEIKVVLHEWTWQADQVTFDGRALDIVVDGKARRSNGKGVRAILRAAFTVALSGSQRSETDHTLVLSCSIRR